MYSGEHQEVITIHKLLSELPLVQSNKRINDHDTECILLADRVKWHHYPPKSSTSRLPTDLSEEDSSCSTIKSTSGIELGLLQSFAIK